MRIDFICPHCGQWWTGNVPVAKDDKDPIVDYCRKCSTKTIGRDSSTKVKKN